MIDQLIQEIIAREGSKDTNNPNDSGGRTKYGISQKWHPEAWVSGPPTYQAAKQIYFTQYFIQPGIHLLQPEFLQSQLADFAVLSGPATAVTHLQTLLKVTPDGVIGPSTLLALKSRDSNNINNLLAIDRVQMIARLVQKVPKDIEFLFGWVNRALSFLRV